MKGDPLVSIRCAVYNHEPFLRQCLDGFVMQKTTFPFEAIVHDDASTDGSAAIIREYAEKYPDIIKPIYETENQFKKGLIFQITEGAMNPNSKYIAICEGDDYWTDPHKLQMQVDFLESHADYTMCFHRANAIDDETGKEYNGEPGKTFRSIEDRDYESTELFSVWTVPTASMVYRKECKIDRSLNFKHRPMYSDIVSVLVCADRGKIRGFDRMMSVYRVQKKGLTFNPQSRNLFIMLSPRHYLFIKDNFPKVDKKVINAVLAKRYWIRSRHDKKRMFHDMLMSFRYDFKVPIWYMLKTIVR